MFSMSDYDVDEMVVGEGWIDRGSENTEYVVILDTPKGLEFARRVGDGQAESITLKTSDRNHATFVVDDAGADEQSKAIALLREDGWKNIVARP